MKIRNGFVSNSSSSSFLVVFPRQPQSVGDVLSMLFGSDPPTHIAAYDESVSTLAIAKEVWHDIQEQLPRLPLSRTVMAEELDGAAYDMIYQEIGTAQRNGQLPVPWQNRKAKSEEQRRREEAEVAAYVTTRSEPLVLEMLEQLTADPNCFICRFHYSDNDGALYSTMEHGDIFHRLPHQRISHH